METLGCIIIGMLTAFAGLPIIDFKNGNTFSIVNLLINIGLCGLWLMICHMLKKNSK